MSLAMSPSMEGVKMPGSPGVTVPPGHKGVFPWACPVLNWHFVYVLLGAGGGAEVRCGDVCVQPGAGPLGSLVSRTALSREAWWGAVLSLPTSPPVSAMVQLLEWLRASRPPWFTRGTIQDKDLHSIRVPSLQGMVKGAWSLD